MLCIQVTIVLLLGDRKLKKKYIYLKKFEIIGSENNLYLIYLFKGLG